ncbi:MAG: GNAT family N-acetyltransferase [Muribaculaceae bacterium]|nr:GNAT family N-acetyltransferase [Muribaculaceae bacterium]
MQQPIIDTVETELIERELTHDRFLRTTNKGGNELYVVDAHTAPATMREIGRLREMTFRAAGGGTGKECDIDEFDTMTPPCRQLIVWDPEHKLILGGYRFIIGNDIKIEAGKPRIATSHMFEFSPEFLRDYLPYTIELGRSFVRTEYQSSRAGAKAIFALDNLWDGLGALTVLHPEIKYLFGKMTMYPNYNRECRDIILHFLNTHFPDPERLVVPITPLPTTPATEIADLFHHDSFKEDYKVLNSYVRAHGYNIPPLVNAYMSLSPTMKCFGTAINDLFGDVEETGIFFAIEDIFEEKKRRHIESFVNEKSNI